MQTLDRVLIAGMAALAAVAVATTVPIAQEADTSVHVAGSDASYKNVFRAGAFRSDPQGDAHGRFNVDVDDFGTATGLRLSVERKVGRIAGLDFKFTSVKHDLSLHQGGERFTEKSAVRTFGMDVLFHPGHTGRHVDCYLGFGLAYVDVGGELSNLSGVAAPLLRTGADIKFGRTGRWGINLDVQRLFTNVFDPTDQTNDYNAVYYGAAVALSF